MVATLLRLKLRLLGHTLAREPWRLVVLLLGAMWALMMLPGLVVGLLWLAETSVEVRHDVLVLGGSLVGVGWALVPVLVAGLDDALEPSRFATFGVPLRRLLPGLLVAGLVGVPGLFAVVLCLAPVVAWIGAGLGATVTAVAVAPLAVVTYLLVGRVATAGAGRLLAGRRARLLAAVVGAVLAAAVIVAAGTVARAGPEDLEPALEHVPAVADVLAWTPAGLPWAAPAATAQGAWWLLGGQVAASLAWIALGLWAWHALLHRDLVRPVVRDGGRRHGDRILGSVAPRGGPARGAVTRRVRRAWLSDSRRLTTLVGELLLALIIVPFAAVLGVPAAIGLGVVVAGAIGWGRHNELAYDGEAFWQHVAAAVPGRVDVGARIGAMLTWALPLVLLAALSGTAWSGRWELWPAAVGAAVGVLGLGLGVSAVGMVLLAYPVPPPGSNPFATRSGAAGAAFVAQVAASGVTLVLSAPLIVLLVLASWRDPVLGWSALVLGVVAGVAGVWGGVRLGGGLLERRRVAVLARLVR